MNYCLVYGISETRSARTKRLSAANYYLDYYTSEIPAPMDALPARVNYCLIYDASETAADGVEDVRLVNYYLGYGNSETKARCVVSIP